MTLNLPEECCCNYIMARCWVCLLKLLIVMGMREYNDLGSPILFIEFAWLNLWVVATVWFRHWHDSALETSSHASDSLLFLFLAYWSCRKLANLGPGIYLPGSVISSLNCLNFTWKVMIAQVFDFLYAGLWLSIYLKNVLPSALLICWLCLPVETYNCDGN